MREKRRCRGEAIRTYHHAHSHAPLRIQDNGGRMAGFGIYLYGRGLQHSPPYSPHMYEAYQPCFHHDKEAEKRGRVTNFYKFLPILDMMPDTFRYSDFREEAEKVGLYPNAAKRALKKYTANGLLSKDKDIYKKTVALKERYI